MAVGAGSDGNVGNRRLAWALKRASISSRGVSGRRAAGWAEAEVCSSAARGSGGA